MEKVNIHWELEFEHCYVDCMFQINGYCTQKATHEGIAFNSNTCGIKFKVKGEK